MNTFEVRSEYVSHTRIKSFEKALKSYESAKKFILSDDPTEDECIRLVVCSEEHDLDVVVIEETVKRPYFNRYVWKRTV